MFRFFYLILLALILLTCKAENSQKDSGVAGKTSAGAPMATRELGGYLADDVDQLTRSGKKDGETESQEKASSFISPKIGDLKIGRLLEYNVDLTFTTENFLASRKFLLELSSKYGFVKSENLQVENLSSVSHMSATFHVKSANLYQVLLELDKLGTLTQENINVEDHTETFALEQIHTRRERIRSARRSELALRSSSKAAVEAEALLGESEDTADSAEFEKWKILDRVSWAKITINIYGPQKPKVVEVPNFRDAFIDLLSLSLQLILFTIYAIPFGILAALLLLAFRFAKKRWFK